MSGLTKEILEASQVTFHDVQKTMLELINGQTILIGHSLENDLKVLKLIHSTVVDTAVLYSKSGKKCSLKQLAKEEFNKVIQNEEMGHNSAEDALMCMKLMKKKVEKDCENANKPKAPVLKTRHTKPMLFQ